MICFDLIGFYLESLVKKYGAWLHKCMKSKSSNFDGVIMKNVFPNITGSCATSVFTSFMPIRFEGCIDMQWSGQGNSAGVELTNTGDIRFKASNSNFIYNGNTVQVSSARVLMVCRT